MSWQSFPRRHRRFLEGELSAPLTDPQRGVIQRSKEVLQGDQGATVALLGPRGTGKTLLGCILAHNYPLWMGEQYPDWRAQQVPGYMPLGDLFAREKASWRVRDEESPLLQARRPSILVLDEVQERSESDWESQELTRLIDARYRDMQPTILIGNQKLAEFSKSVGSSTVSRIQEAGEIFICDWPSFRGVGR